MTRRIRRAEEEHEAFFEHKDKENQDPYYIALLKNAMSSFEECVEAIRMNFKKKAALLAKEMIAKMEKTVSMNLNKLKEIKEE